MKNLFLLNRLGFNPDLTTRQSRVDSVSIASRYRVLAILLLFFILGSGNVWGADVTLTLSDNSTDTWTNQGASGGGTAIAMYDKSVTGITLSGTSGYCNTSNSYTQIYASSVTTIESTVGNITKIIFNGKYNKTSGKFTDTNSTYQAFTSSFSNKTFTYASGVSSMAFTADKQILLKSATVYYAVATTSTTSITGLDYTEGSGPSTAQSFTVSGTDLAGNLTVSAPDNFEVSKSEGSGYASSVTLTKNSSGVVSSTTIYVRLKSGKSAGTYGGASTYVTVTGGGIITKNVSVSGTVSGGAITCDDPTGTSLGTTTHALTGLGSQVLNWTGAASNYEIYYNGSGNAPGDEPSATINGAKTLTLTNLAPGTWYWWVRAKCSESLKSDWVSGGNFTINGIKLTNIEMTPTPHIDFGTVLQGASVAAVNIKVTGVGLSSSSTITHSFDVATPFTATPASLDYNVSKTNLTVTPSTATASEFSRALTITNGTYSQTVTVTMNVVAADRFIDVLQNTSGYEAATPHIETGTYSTPTLADKSVATSGTCEEQHYHFVGWITAAKYAAGTTITDGDLQTPITASNVTYYAVWAKQGTGGGGSSTETLTGAEIASHFTSSAVAYGDAEKSYTDGDITWAARFNANAGVPWFQLKNDNAVYLKITAPAAITKLDMNVSNTSCSGAGCTMNMSAHGYSGSNISLNTAADGSGTTVANASPASSYAFSLSPTGSNSTLYLKVSGATRIWADITVTYSGGVSYTDYLAKCCDNMVAAPTVSATDIHAHQFTLTWTNVTGADDYTVTCAGGTVGAVQSSSTTRTCTITGLASANTSYSWSVVATYSGSYCGATPADGSTTTAQEYSVSYNANGGTVSPLPSTVSYEAGVTVTVAAEPGSPSKSGCTFTGWNTQADGQGTHYAASGSATFTMPSSAVTLYAEWTKKKNYYVDRMHGTNDGHTVTIGGVVYNCYLREGANYTVPTISDNTTGASACHSEHDHLLFWVTESSVNDDGTLKNSYTEVTPGDTKTALSDGTIYYAIWGKLAD